MTNSLLLFLITLRWRALVRSLRYLVKRDAFGIFLVMALCLVFGVIVAKNIHREISVVFIITLHGALLSFLHSLRKDAPFLAWLGVPPRKVFCVEYSILAVPGIIALLFTPFPWLFVLPLLISCAFAVILPEQFSSIFRLHQSSAAQGQKISFQHLTKQGFITFLPSMAFEWQGGLRQRKVMVGILWIGSLLLAWQPFLLSVLLVILALVPVEFYGIGEHRTMLQALCISPSQFLRLKIKQGFLGYSFLLTPLVCLGMGVYLVKNVATIHISQQVLFIIAAFGASCLVCLILSALCVLAKYAFYAEGLPFSFAVSTVVVLSLLTLWHPFISIIGLGTSFSILTSKAHKRLRLLGS
ncbi:MAG: hypothetical protein MUF71_02495 [Candidatus Kapabacteria bacterium]|jgi:hypothetical protein|nr:hypothetical protein [Candidatus Kapabacteria bacterium]